MFCLKAGPIGLERALMGSVVCLVKGMNENVLIKFVLLLSVLPESRLTR